MSPTVRDARLKTAEYEKRAAVASDPEVRQFYTQLAREWREMARQREQLEADLRDLVRKENEQTRLLRLQFLAHVVA